MILSDNHYIDFQRKYAYVVSRMENRIVRGVIVMLVLCLLTDVCLAANISNGQSGKSNVAHLYLYEKDPSDWEIVSNGSWAKMKYEISGETFEFVLNAHNLSVGANYTLIYYPDPWPGQGLICLGDGTVNDEGNLHMKGCVDSGDLPAEFDENDGAKLWLVLSDDMSCEDARMIGWQPVEYLFEYDLISFDDVDDEPILLEEELLSSQEPQVELKTVPMGVNVDEFGEEDEQPMKNREHLQSVFARILQRMSENQKGNLENILETMAKLGLLR